jgi:serine/threonine protein kinase
MSNEKQSTTTVITLDTGRTICVQRDDVVKASNQGTVVLGVDQASDESLVVKISHPFEKADAAIAAPDDHLHMRREIHVLPQLLGISGVPQYVGYSQETLPEGERLYLVMTRMPGQDLEERRKQNPDRRLTTTEALDMLRQASRILGSAHERGIIHRDLKLSNFMIDEASGRLSIVDWGTAKEVSERHDGFSGSTPEGSVIGTVQFMSVEQITGKPLDGRTDVYTLGAVVALLRYGPGISQRYTVNTAGELTERSKADIAASIAAHETIKYDLMPASNDSDERLLQSILRQMTDPDREERLQSMDEVGERIDQAGS